MEGPWLFVAILIVLAIFSGLKVTDWLMQWNWFRSGLAGGFWHAGAAAMLLEAGIYLLAYIITTECYTDYWGTWMDEPALNVCRFPCLVINVGTAAIFIVKMYFMLRNVARQIDNIPEIIPSIDWNDE